MLFFPPRFDDCLREDVAEDGVVADGGRDASGGVEDAEGSEEGADGRGEGDGD